MKKLKRYYTRDELERATTVSVPAAAKILGIGESTAYRHADNGVIPVFRIGGRRVVPAKWLREQIDITGDTSGLRTDPTTLPPAA